MESALIKEIARQIVNEEILLNWKFYGLILLLQFPIYFASKFLEKYAGKRGETLATKADFQEILRQLHRTTETAESIKAQVAHKDWSLKEYKTLRRVKLEELMSSLYEMQTLTEGYLKAALFNKDFDDFDALNNKIVLLTKLYFPELQGEIAAFRDARADAHQWFMELNGKAIARQEGLEAFAAFFDANKQKSRDATMNLYRKLTAVEAKAQLLMEEILEYPDETKQAKA